MKKVLELLFFMIISVSGLSGMFSSEDDGTTPLDGFRFKHRTVRYNKDLRLVIPKTCRDQKLYDWVPTEKSYENGQWILKKWEKQEVIKKEIDPSLLDDEGNLIIAEWFKSKNRPFQEPEFIQETSYKNKYTHWSPYGISNVTFNTTEPIKHEYYDEYSKSYMADETRAENKKKIHTYIDDVQSQQGIWTYLRGMKIVELLFGKSQQKVEHSQKLHSWYKFPLGIEWNEQYNQLRSSLEFIEEELKKDNNNAILQNQKTLVTEEIESFKNKENYLSFVRSSMKRSEFNKYQEFCMAVERE